MSEAEPRHASKLTRYGVFNTRDALKVIAVLAMFIDHAGVFYFDEEKWMRVIGRYAAPIFMFLAGYASNYRPHRELLLGALILCMLPLLRGFEFFPVNILVSIILARLLLSQIECGRLKLRKPLEWFGVLLILYPLGVFFQYGTVGIMYAIAGYMYKRPEKYDAVTRIVFLGLALAVQTGTEMIVLGNEHLLLYPFLIAVFASIGYAFSRFEIKPLPAFTHPKALHLALLFTSRYTLWIYVIHYGALQLITGQNN